MTETGIYVKTAEKALQSTASRWMGAEWGAIATLRDENQQILSLFTVSLQLIQKLESQELPSCLDIKNIKEQSK